MPSHIFISYRRDDAAGDAGRLADHLYRRFGADRVFLDIDTIEPGTDFVRVLRGTLEETAAVLVVIGPRWMSLRAADGTPRLTQSGDFVRLEVETALERGIRVVPVLVQGAALPRAEDLPASLAALATRQVFVLDHAEFHDDAERLCDRLEKVIAPPKPWPLGRRLWPDVGAALVVVIALGFAGYRVARTTDGEQGAASTTARADPASPDLAERAADEGRTTPEATAASGTALESAAGRRAGRGAATARAATEPGGDEDATLARRTPAQNRRAEAEALLAEVSAQRRRGQTVDALATLARAREMAPASPAVREAQESVAMEWIRNVRFESGKSTFGEAIKPALAVVDAALPTATGARRADLLAHSGWASFMLWRDGNRQLDPAEWYREALSLDPQNPYANAMLAHWVLFQGRDVPRAVQLFDVALRTGRAVDAVRSLQWAAFRNSSTPEADVERVRLADAMRRNGETLNMAQASALLRTHSWYSSDKNRQMLVEALPPDDHISTLSWGLDGLIAADESRRPIVRFYVALLHARAGRVDQAMEILRALEREAGKNPGSMRDAVQAALKRLQSPRR